MGIVWGFLKSVGKHWWALMSCALFTILGAYILHENKSNTWAINATFALAGVCLFVACFLAWLDEHKKLSIAVANGRSIENGLIEKVALLEKEINDRTPRLKTVVHEVLLSANPNTADVFVDAEIFNERPGTESTIRAYELSLRRDGKDYVSKTVLNDISKYQTLNVYESYENGYLQFDHLDHKSLSLDLASEISYDRPIRANVPRRGWLHFLIDGMPQWPSEDWPTGDAVYLQPSFDDDGEVESEGGWEEKTIRIRNTRSAESVTLIVHYQTGKTDPCTAKILHSGNRKIRKIPMPRVDKSKLL